MRGPAPFIVGATISHNGVVLSDNKRSQKITVAVIVGVVIISLALSLVSVALSSG